MFLIGRIIALSSALIGTGSCPDVLVIVGLMTILSVGFSTACVFLVIQCGGLSQGKKHYLKFALVCFPVGVVVGVVNLIFGIYFQVMW